MRLFPEAPARLADSTLDEIDMLFVRENTQAEYVGGAGRAALVFGDFLTDL